MLAENLVSEQLNMNTKVSTQSWHLLHVTAYSCKDCLLKRPSIQHQRRISPYSSSPPLGPPESGVPDFTGLRYSIPRLF